LGAINTGRPTLAIFQLGQSFGPLGAALLARLQQLGAHRGEKLAPLRFNHFPLARPLLSQLGDGR
jgi:hypothetical protein